NFQSSKKYPLIVFLHGSGERGRDNEKQLMHGGDLFMRPDVRLQFPAIVVFPQCPDGATWANYLSAIGADGQRSFDFGENRPPTRPMILLQQLIATLQKDYPVDDKKIYIGGLSLGGMGTYELARRNPKLIAAAFPICGAADSSIAVKVNKINWWIFHGAKDNVVPPVYSIKIAEELKKQKANVRFTLYPEANHNSWDSAFAEKDLLPWLFAQHR
ncbi:MAG TPA: dienelactone hydrolase family protein, partial [Flavisolibacter sp.]|nr:dienelactone hydrolase family protein [Flavisolibacter sp.]